MVLCCGWLLVLAREGAVCWQCGPAAELVSCSFRSPCLEILPLTDPHPGLLPSPSVTSPPHAPRASSPACLSFPSQPGQPCREAPREHPHRTLCLSAAPSCSLQERPGQLRAIPGKPKNATAESVPRLCLHKAITGLPQHSPATTSLQG